MNTYEPIFAQNIKEGDTINFSEFQPAFTVTKIKMVLNGVIVTDNKGNTLRKVLPPKMIVKKLVAMVKEPEDSDEEKEIEKEVKSESTKHFYKNLKAASSEKQDNNFADTSMRQVPAVQTTIIPASQKQDIDNRNSIQEQQNRNQKIINQTNRVKNETSANDTNNINSAQNRVLNGYQTTSKANIYTAHSESGNENILPSANTNNDKKEKSVDLDKPKVSESSKNSLKRLVNFESKAESPNGVDDQYLDSPGPLGKLARKLHKANSKLSSDKYKRNIVTALRIAAI